MIKLYTYTKGNIFSTIFKNVSLRLLSNVLNNNTEDIVIALYVD